jgi:hypothetical protein
LARLIFDSEMAHSVIIAVESKAAMTLVSFISILLWVEVLAVAFGLLLLDFSQADSH